MESWRKVWRDGLSPSLSTKGLLALKEALTHDDDRLAQGFTVTPPPMRCVWDWPVEAADPIGFCGWMGDGLKSVGEVEEFFAKVCFETDQRIGEPAVVRYFLNFWDDTPRDEARRLLLAEVCLALSERAVRAAPPPADGAAVEYGVLRHPRHEDTVELPAAALVAGARQ